MAQITISLPQDQLKQNRFLLLSIGGVASVAGLFIWSVAPFATSRVAVRYLALGSTLTCGVAAVVAGKKLQRITPLIQALETAERDDFLLQLAVAQFSHEQQHWNTVLQQAPVAPETALPVAEVKDPVKEVKNSGNDAIPGNAESYRPLYLAVKHLQQEGVADSRIVKQVLGMEGGNFAKGQKALQAILDLGLQQGW
jgi:hypothetical protein